MLTQSEEEGRSAKEPVREHSERKREEQPGRGSQKPWEMSKGCTQRQHRTRQVRTGRRPGELPREPAGTGAGSLGRQQGVVTRTQPTGTI